MRYLNGYTWDKMLDELVPRTLLSLDLLKKEKELEEKEMNKANRKGKK